MKPIVSKRNNFDGAREITERLLVGAPNELKHPNLGKWLAQCVEYVISDVASSCAVGAQRGIEQVACLLRDPEFNEHRRESRKKMLKKWKEREAKADLERKEREAFPTAEQISQSIHECDRQIVWHRQQVEKYEKRILELHSKTPSDSFEKTASKITQ